VAIIATISSTSGLASAQAAPPTSTTRLVAYGHSWPAGFGVAEGYPAEAASALGLSYVDRARGGDLVAGTAARAELQPPQANDVVVVEAGLNDARAYGKRGLAPYRDFLAKALSDLAPADRVVLVLDQRILKWRQYAPYNHASRDVIHAFRLATREVAAGYPNVTVVSPQLRGAIDFQADGVHPDASGHRLIARAVVEVLR
jgi:lysophospholipase L1-like esterase